MNQRNIDKLIPITVEYLSKTENEVVKNGNVVEKEFSSYLSSFGPTIRQSGMMKALAVYGRKDVGAKRYVIDDLVKQIMLKGILIDAKYNKKDYNLIDIYLLEINAKDELTRIEFEDRILEAIVACKLALQLFHIEKKKEGAK
jgi:hypothetical protein